MFGDRTYFEANTPNLYTDNVWNYLNMIFQAENMPYVAIKSSDAKHNVEAIKAFQRMVGLNDDGKMGPDTLKAMTEYLINNVIPFNGQII